MHRWEVTALKAQRWRREGVKYGGGGSEESSVGESASCQRWMCLEFPGVELSLLSDSPRRTSSSPPTPAPPSTPAPWTPLAPQIKRGPAPLGGTARA